MDPQQYSEKKRELAWRAACLHDRYGYLPRDLVKLWFWAERRAEEVYVDPGESIASYIWWDCCAGPGQVNYLLDRSLWELCHALGLPLQGRDRTPLVLPENYVNLGYHPSLRSFTYEVFPDHLPLEPLETLIALMEDEEEEVGDTALEDFSVSLQQAIQESVGFIESSRESLLSYFRDQIDRTYALLSEILRVMSPESSQFIAFKDGYPFFPFRDQEVQGIQVIPNADQAEVVTNPQNNLRCGTNLFDVVCLGFHTILSYLGAHRFPRPYFFPDESGEESPQWQIPCLADHVAQLHQELRDQLICSFEVRTGPGEEDKEEVFTTLNEAVSSIAGSVSEISLDVQRAHLLAAQAARTALTISAQIGTATFPGTVDLGWRGKVTAPSTNAASIAQVLASIEAALNELSVALGIAPKGGG